MAHVNGSSWLLLLSEVCPKANRSKKKEGGDLVVVVVGGNSRGNSRGNSSVAQLGCAQVRALLGPGKARIIWRRLGDCVSVVCALGATVVGAFGPPRFASKPNCERKRYTGRQQQFKLELLGSRSCRKSVEEKLIYTKCRAASERAASGADRGHELSASARAQNQLGRVGE